MDFAGVAFAGAGSAAEALSPPPSHCRLAASLASRSPSLLFVASGGRSPSAIVSGAPTRCGSCEQVLARFTPPICQRRDRCSIRIRDRTVSGSKSNPSRSQFAPAANEVKMGGGSRKSMSKLNAYMSTKKCKIFRRIDVRTHPKVHASMSSPTFPHLQEHTHCFLIMIAVLVCRCWNFDTSNLEWAKTSAMRNLE